MATEPHATLLEIEALVRGVISPAARRRLVRHLLRGCSSCREALAEAVPTFNSDECLPQKKTDSDPYEFATRRAQRWLKQTAHSLHDLRAFAAKELLEEGALLRCQAPLLVKARAEAWLEAARAARHENLASSLQSACVASAFASQLDIDDFGAAEIANLKVRCWAEVANAHRLAGDLPLAERALRSCAVHLRRCRADVLVHLELAFFGATLLKDCRQYAEAEGLFARCHRGYTDLELDHFAGRCQIARGLLAGLLHEFDRGTQLLIEGLDLIQTERDPSLALAAYHSLILYRAEARSYAAASELLHRAKPLYRLWGGEVDLLKKRWLEARIQLGLEDFVSAECGFADVRAAFQVRELPYQAALVTLDLCLVWLRVGRVEALKAAAGEMLATFVALKIGPEAFASLQIFVEAAKQERATYEMVERLAATLSGHPEGRGVGTVGT